MKNMALLLAAWVVVGVAAAPVAGQAYYLEGEITAAFAWHPPFLNTGGGGPLAYRGIFAHDADSGRARFEIQVANDYHAWPSTDLLFGKSYDGVVETDDAHLAVELTSLPMPSTWTTSLELALDKLTGSGQWHWIDGPPTVCTPTVCAPSLPESYAVGTITAFRVIPEPESLAMMLTAVATCGWLRRRT